MYTDFTIKNFRIFDEEGTTAPLRPITILTGCNNTGKSSIVKALCLLKDFCQQIETDYEDGKKLQLENYKMDFHKSPNSLMGGFNLVLHHHRKADTDKNNDAEANESIKEHNNKHIIIEGIVESSWLLQDVILHLEFASLDWDELNNGYLQAYCIKTLDGKVIYKAERDGQASMDFSIVKKSLLHFLYGQYAFSTWQNEIAYCNATSSYPSGKDKKAELFDESIKLIIENLGPTKLIYLLEWQSSHCRYMWRDGTCGTCASLLKKVPEYSFVINSPKLGVFCYFPCLDIFKDINKEDVRKEVNKRLESLDEPISSLDHKIVNLFLDAFGDSDAENLNEFINQKENSRFFINSSFSRFGKKGFAFPESFWNIELNTDLLDESSLPKTANWSVILSAMDLINKATTNSSHSLITFDEVNMCWHYKMENFIDEFLRNVIEEIFVNLLPGSMTYSPTTIVQPKRLFSLEDNNDFAKTLKRYFESKRSFEEEKDTGIYYHADSGEKDYKPCMFIDKWLKQLGIADHVEIKTHADGYGVTIHLYENEKDMLGMQLVDKGFGVLQLFAVLLKIEIAILETKTNEKLYKYDTTGLNKEIIKYLRTHNQLHPATVALEEPECHLHPSLQSKFADMLVDANKQYGIHFLVESHSEYFIRKLQLLVSQDEIDNEDISLLYVNPASRPSYIPVITDIGLEKDGTLKNEFGSGFFDESLRLSKEFCLDQEQKKMKTKRDIYCEYAFWEAFFEMEESILRDRSKRKLWDAFYEFLSNNNLFFDISNQAINGDTCGGANLMRIRQEKGGAGIKFIPKKFPKFEDFSDNDDARLNAVFLITSETAVCENLSERFGVIVFNLSMIFSANHVYINNGVSFDRANGQNWTYLWELRDKCPSISCCNSLLIADRYLLADLNESAFDNNLRPIFEALLPQRLDNDIIFNISIIAQNICRSIEEKLLRIEKLVKELRPRLRFSLNIFNSKKIHDRSILTNNIILTSGAGFDVIGNNEIPLKFTTTSLYFPFLQFDPNGSNKYIDWINNVLKVERSCRSYQQNYWGEEKPRHHLLDYYYEEPVMPKATFSIGSAFADVLMKARITN